MLYIREAAVKSHLLHIREGTRHNVYPQEYGVTPDPGVPE
jgi:hypothetical protein